MLNLNYLTLSNYYPSPHCCSDCGLHLPDMSSLEAIKMSANPIWVVFIILVLNCGTHIEFKLPQTKIDRTRARIRCVIKWLKENQLDGHTASKLKKMACNTYESRYHPPVLYTTLPNVLGRVTEFLSGPSKSGKRDYPSDPFSECNFGMQSDARWPELLFTLSVLNALYSVGITCSGRFSSNINKFKKNIENGHLTRAHGYTQALRTMVLSIPYISHELQTKFMEIMEGVPQFNSSGFDPKMEGLVRELQTSPYYIAGIKIMKTHKADAAKKAE